MKKLKLDHFKIAKLTNLQSIRGGDGDGDGGGETGIRVCVQGSEVWVTKKKSIDGKGDNG